MAKALQCNKCGGYFNPLTVEGEFMRFSNPSIKTKDDCKDNLRGRYFDPVAGLEDAIDLCPECTKEFIIFMEEGQL